MIDPIVVRSAEEIAALPDDTLSVKGDSLHDDDLAGIGRLTELQELYLDGCQELSDTALREKRPGLSIEIM